jgi:hypothetical protein
MNLVVMEMFATFWGIPVDFVSSLTLGELMKNSTICLTTGLGLGLSGKF